MFLNAHERIAVPSTLGPVVLGTTGGAIFSTVGYPGLRVPAIIAFMNDGDQAVTLHFDASNNKAEVIGTVAGTYNISGSDNALLIGIDGATPIAITLTSGGARTAAQVATDINTAFAAQAAGSPFLLARAYVSGTFVAVVSGTVGQGSQVVIGTPASNSGNATLGFTAGTYTNSNSFIQDIVSAITINPKAYQVFNNPRPGAKSLQIRGTGGGVATVIDATVIYPYSGVQQ